MIAHLVAFTFKPDVTEEQVREATGPDFRVELNDTPIEDEVSDQT